MSAATVRPRREVTHWPARDDDKYFLLVFVKTKKSLLTVSATAVHCHRREGTRWQARDGDKIQ